jgi:hypothetical protein
MYPRTIASSFSACRPYLWGAAAATALDHVLDIQSLFVPVLLAVILGEVITLTRRGGR